MTQQILDQEIFKKTLGGKRIPFLGINGLYNILYRTTFIVDGRIYVGVHSSTKVYDSYIGCGVDADYCSELNYNYSRNSFVGLVKRYGVKSFVRENLLYFNSIDEALFCERLVVDRSWISNPKTLNLRVGGYRPPTLFREKNGNYQNSWSKERREEMSKKRRDGGKSKGSLNGMAKPIVFIDTYTNERRDFSCAKDAHETLKPKANYMTLLSFVSQEKLYDRRWVCLWLEDYLKILDISSYVERLIENSRFKKNILIKRNDCKKY